MTFVFVDMGMPHRVMNVPLYPTPNSVMFWDFLVLSVYGGLNLVIGIPMLMAERARKEPPYYILKPVIYLSIAWAPLIHTVTAFLYAGVPGRHHWLTAIMAVRFLAGAFAAGPSLLLILYTILKRFTSFDDGGKEPYKKLSQIILYAMVINMFCLGLEFFTAYYSNIPGHMHPLDYLYFGHGGSTLVPIMWLSLFGGVGSIFLLLIPRLRNDPKVLPYICAMIFISALLEKGYGLIVGGFTPNPFGRVTPYIPTGVETLISVGIYAIGFLIITVLYKMVISVREEAAR
jgi:molybdopterin-containing oxidoreductase family membrane subunit